MSKQPSNRSLEYLREKGYLTWVTENWNPYTKRKKDLYGFIDLVALHSKETGVLGIQTTSGDNLLARIKKAEELNAYWFWLSCGNPVEFHGWRKILVGKRKLWRPIIKRFDIPEFLK